MPNTLGNRVKMSVSGTPGTGTITLGSAVSGFQTFAAAGIPNAATVPYVIEDGSNWEIGVGTYTSSGTTLARTTVTASSNSGSAISATSSAIVMISPLAADLQAGTAAYNLVQLDGSAKLPAVDGSALTSLNASNISSGTLTLATTIKSTNGTAFLAQNATSTGSNAFRFINASGSFYFGTDNSTGADYGTGTGYAAFIYSNYVAPICFFTNGTERFRVDGAGSVIVGTAALSTSATNGFLYIPTCAGAPSGTPTTFTGRSPIVYDSTNNKIYVYNGAWKATAALT